MSETRNIFEVIRRLSAIVPTMNEGLNRVRSSMSGQPPWMHAHAWEKLIELVKRDAGPRTEECLHIIAGDDDKQFQMVGA